MGFEPGFFSNSSVNLGLADFIVLELAVTEWFALAGIFYFQSLPWLHFLILLASSSLFLWLGELYKVLRSKM